ncbi:MAG: twin transmembrane helix small protein [Rhodospirillales bacterium]|nr:twin transmembrane helix small protein [Rhodospirillales bacterium]
MRLFLVIAIGVLMLATLGVLLAGMLGMARGGDPRRSNALMRWRIILQGSALLLFAILMLLGR